MAKILEFVRPENAFGSELIAVVSAAYEKALHSVHDRGEPEIVRQIIAKYIVVLAMEGERDPELLCSLALTAVGLLGARE